MKKPDAHIVVSLPRTLKVLGFDKNEAMLVCDGRIYAEGREALYAIMTNRKTVDRDCILRGGYPSHVEETLNDGHVALSYLVNCTGMSVRFDEFFRDAEEFVQRHSGTITSFATDNAQSGGAFRLGGAPHHARYALPDTEIMLHTRQSDADIDPRIEKMNKKIDLEKIHLFFGGQHDRLPEIARKTLEEAGRGRDVHWTGKDLAAHALLTVQRDRSQMRNTFFALFPDLQDAPPIPLIEKFFAEEQY